MRFSFLNQNLEASDRPEGMGTFQHFVPGDISKEDATVNTATQYAHNNSQCSKPTQLQLDHPSTSALAPQSKKGAKR